MLSRPSEPRVLPRPAHCISRRNIDPNAIKVLYRLHRAGYKSYLVGGGVRDLLLGRRPKDFDVVTDARPDDIRRLFRNSRLIGRRFRLAHIMFRDSIIEVSTFRRDPDPQHQKRQAGELLVTSDNTFGSPREDAFRRDFTVNALFYNIADFSVIDYIGGIDDLERQTLRVIGDPDLRFREDPVRMLRACEFASRLGFTIDPRTQEFIRQHRQEMAKASPARLAEELIQLLGCGAAGGAMQWLLELGLLEILLPEAQAMIQAKDGGLGDTPQILPTIDELISQGRSLTDVPLLAAFLVPQVELRCLAAETRNRKPLEPRAFSELVHDTVGTFFSRFPLSNLKERQVAQALETLHKLRQGPKNRDQRLRLLSRPSFKDALLVFEILAAATGQCESALKGWQAAQSRRRGTKSRSRSRRRRNRRRRRRPKGNNADGG